LIDGKCAEYVGYVSGPQAQANFSLAQKALLYPIQYPEAFGLVLLEAMSAAPTIAPSVRRGSGKCLEVAYRLASADTMQNVRAVIPNPWEDRLRYAPGQKPAFSAEKWRAAYLQTYEAARKTESFSSRISFHVTPHALRSRSPLVTV